MQKLKLFVSHSSGDDHHLQLLKATCQAIRDAYGNRVEVLVDKDGLMAGDDWNHRLNLWLAECHVAIILFSKRAIEKSGWVAKEAAILSWRAELDKDFTLIPVMLDGESTPEDLAKDFFGVLQIDQNQCVRNARNTVDILQGIKPKLCERLSSGGAYPLTPLERLQEGIAKLLGDATTSASLQSALEEVGCPLEHTGASHHQQYADRLARHLLTATDGDSLDCFRLFQLGIDPLEPKPNRNWVNKLFKVIRSLWVEPRAAACIPMALQHRLPLVMTGNYVNTPESDLNLESDSGIVAGYTLKRYLERAWPDSNLYFNTVTLTNCDRLDQMQGDVRLSLLGPIYIKNNSGETLDGWINADPKKIIVVVTPTPSKSELPDARQLAELCKLAVVYQRAIVILDMGTDPGGLPPNVRLVKPLLDLKIESAASAKERLAKQFVDKFGDA